MGEIWHTILNYLSPDQKIISKESLKTLSEARKILRGGIPEAEKMTNVPRTAEEFDELEMTRKGQQHLFKEDMADPKVQSKLFREQHESIEAIRPRIVFVPDSSRERQTLSAIDYHKGRLNESDLGDPAIELLLLMMKLDDQITQRAHGPTSANDLIPERYQGILRSILEEGGGLVKLIEEGTQGFYPNIITPDGSSLILFTAKGAKGDEKNVDKKTGSGFIDESGALLRTLEGLTLDFKPGLLRRPFIADEAPTSQKAAEHIDGTISFHQLLAGAERTLRTRPNISTD